MKLHKYQLELLKILKERKGDLKDVPLRTLSALMGIPDRAQVVVHHLDQLENKGYIRRLTKKERLYEVLESPVKDIAYINLYSASAQCGPEGLLGEDGIIDKIPVSTKTFGISNPDQYFLIKAKGESMEKMIHDGDLVLVREQTDVDSGQIAVVVHEEMPKIKKILKNGNHYVLVSLNPDFNDQEVVAGDDPNFRICGLVKGVLKVS